MLLELYNCECQPILKKLSIKTYPLRFGLSGSSPDALMILFTSKCERTRVFCYFPNEFDHTSNLTPIEMCIEDEFCDFEVDSSLKWAPWFLINWSDQRRLFREAAIFIEGIGISRLPCMRMVLNMYVVQGI